MIKVFKNDSGDYVCELWGGSTKHPDSVFHFEDFHKVDYISDDNQIFQWLLECASKLTFPPHAKELVEYALKNWVLWED